MNPFCHRVAVLVLLAAFALVSPSRAETDVNVVVNGYVSPTEWVRYLTLRGYGGLYHFILEFTPGHPAERWLRVIRERDYEGTRPRKWLKAETDGRFTEMVIEQNPVSGGLPRVTVKINGGPERVVTVTENPTVETLHVASVGARVVRIERVIERGQPMEFMLLGGSVPLVMRRYPVTAHTLQPHEQFEAETDEGRAILIVTPDHRGYARFSVAGGEFLPFILRRD